MHDEEFYGRLFHEITTYSDGVTSSLDFTLPDGREGYVVAQRGSIISARTWGDLDQKWEATDPLEAA